jgi:hypothetical protein
MERRDRRSNLRSKCRILRRRLQGAGGNSRHPCVLQGYKSWHQTCPATCRHEKRGDACLPPFRFCPRTVAIRQVLGGQYVRASHIGR